MKVLEALTMQLATLNQRLDRLQTTGLPVAGMPAAEAAALAPVPAPAAPEEFNEDLLLPFPPPWRLPGQAAAHSTIRW